MVRVDISAVLAVEQRARDALTGEGVAGVMRRVVDVVASNERAQHRYENQTGDLERATRGQTMETGERVVVELIMDTPYAEYVRRHPGGLTEIDAQARVAEAAILVALEAQGRRIVGG